MGRSMRQRGAALAVVALLAVGCVGDSGTDDAGGTTAATDAVGNTAESTSTETSITESAEPATTAEPADADLDVDIDLDDDPDVDASALEPGTVTVSIGGIDDAAGGYVAGVLHQSELTAQSAVGGFGVEVDSDSFATSEVVREPQADPDYDNTLFPYVSDGPLVVDFDNHYLQLWFAPSEMGPYSRWVPADSPGLRGCVVQFSLESGTAVRVSVTGVPSVGAEVTLTCPAVSWEAIPSSEASSSSSRLQEQTEWKVALDADGRGIHTVFMITSFPLREADIQGLGGRLIWKDAEIELCRIGIRSVGDGFVRIGDIFQTTESCGTSTGMQQAFDDYGLPDTACVYVRAGGVDDQYCAPLAID